MEIFDKFSGKNRTNNVFYLNYERFTLERFSLCFKDSRKWRRSGSVGRDENSIGRRKRYLVRYFHCQFSMKETHVGIFDEFFGEDWYERRIPYLHYELSQVEEAFSIFEDSTTEGEVR